MVDLKTIIDFFKQNFSLYFLALQNVLFLQKIFKVIVTKLEIS